MRSDVNSAEMIKLAANAFLMTRISFINEIANVCEATGADVVKVAEGVGLDQRLGPHFLRAGIGYGGSCFPKDSLALKQLASNSGYHFQLLSAVIEVNELQKRRVIGKLTRHLGPLRGKTVALLGLAFKANTDDMREAPSIVLASRLLAEGAEVRAWDPVADGSQAAEGRRHRRLRRRRRARRGCRRDRHRMGRAQGARLRGDALGDGESADHRRTQPARSGGDAPRRLRLRRHRPPDVPDRRAARDDRPNSQPRPRRLVEAIILAGGKAERLGDAAGGRPKALVDVAGTPLAGYQVARLARAGVSRVIVSCAAGQGDEFERDLAGLGAEIVIAEEQERLGRGGGIKFAAQRATRVAATSMR